MADKINVSTQDLRDYSEQMRTINRTLNEKLEDINKEMNNLEGTWVSEGGETIRQAMNAMKPKFEQFYTIVESYSAFLDTTAETYEVTESSVKSNASAFIS